ncbi:MAG: chemotaxis protein CheW [Nitrospirales bacterium]
MSEPKQYCTFYLDDLFFGVDVLLVQEVIKFQDMTNVPLASKVVQGLINLRGQIVTAIDLRRRLELNERPVDQEPMNIVIQTDDGAVSLLVDEIGDVLEVTEDTLDPPPNTVKGTARELITGVHKLDGCLLLILDTEKAMTVTHSLAGVDA